MEGDSGSPKGKKDVPAPEASAGPSAGKKSHLQHLRDLQSAARSQAKYWQDRDQAITEEIHAIQHKERGLEVGYIVEDSYGKRAQVTRLNTYWIYGRYLKKNGEPGGREKTIFGPYKVVSKTRHSLPASAAKPAEGTEAEQSPEPEGGRT